jgi:hypothetical protein
MRAQVRGSTELTSSNETRWNEPVDSTPTTSPRGGTSPGLTPGAWLLNAQALHDEFAELWTSLDPEGGTRPTDSSEHTPAHDDLEFVRYANTWNIRKRATEMWSSTDPVIAGHIARLVLTTPDDWATGFADVHLAHWYRLCLAGHLVAVDALDFTEELRTGLPQLGWSPVEARRLLRGRELGELAMTWAPSGYGPAVSLALGHGQRGWLGWDDVAATRGRLAELDRSRFRQLQHMVPACESLWRLLDTAGQHPDKVLILATPA